MSASSDRPKVCTTPGCEEELPPPSGRGRPRLYCSTKCRSTNTVRGGAFSVEVDYEGDEAASRPTGRVWLVRMRHGRDEAVVATELGRPSADHLAGQIAQLIDRPRRAQGVRWSRQDPRGPVVDYLNVGLRDNANADRWSRSAMAGPGEWPDAPVAHGGYAAWEVLPC